MTRPQTALVIGAGIIGVSVATSLQTRGISTTLVTETRIASGASGRSIAWLNAAARRSPEYHRLRTLGVERLQTVAAHLNHPSWLRFDGAIGWGGAEGTNQVRELYEYQRRTGYQSRWITPGTVEQFVPGIDPSSLPADGATYNAGEGWVDLPSLINHLVTRFLGFGGTVIQNAGRVIPERDGSTVVGGRLKDRSVVRADRTVLAVGPSTVRELTDLGIAIDDRTPISVLAVTHPLNHPLRAVVNSPRVSMRRTPDQCLAIDSSWVEEYVEPDGEGYRIDPQIVQELLAEASKILSGSPTLELDRLLIGPKPIPGDGEPVIGPVPGAENLYTAFTHSGATLGLIIGDVLAELIDTGLSRELLQSFSVERFASSGGNA